MSLTFVGATYTYGGSATVPGGATAGDLLLLLLTYGNNSQSPPPYPTAFMPVGLNQWVAPSGVLLTGGFCGLYAKRHDGHTTSFALPVAPGNSYDTVSIAAYRGVGLPTLSLGDHPNGQWNAFISGALVEAFSPSYYVLNTSGAGQPAIAVYVASGWGANPETTVSGGADSPWIVDSVQARAPLAYTNPPGVNSVQWQHIAGASQQVTAGVSKVIIPLIGEPVYWVQLMALGPAAGGSGGGRSWQLV